VDLEFVLEEDREVDNDDVEVGCIFMKEVKDKLVTSFGPVLEKWKPERVEFKDIIKRCTKFLQSN
jgi:hypothetical protein